jgi:glycerophosphoryl diester phosphodiesterase
MELDVHLSKDGTLFVSHDDTLLRCCGVDRRIEDCTDAELQAMHLEGTEETIPCLSDVFALIDGKVPLLIEAKAAGNSPALADALVAALKDYRGPYCVESFDPRFLLAFRRRAPKTVRGQLSGAINKHGGNLPAPVDFMMGHLLVCCLSRPHFIAYDYRDCRRPSFRFYRWFWRPALFLWTPRSAVARAEAQKERGILIFEETED